ncbi:MAG: hypothetical protein DRQ65_04105 [Gammaproteobacteria bacterium]|nr:MAG: hypothetical protein DRQ98_05925 [Gammaproteobacteria bacterium]RLA55666.1 MAG: hypothetical protein DRQ65_04105 [Gammaproteobacteria bacterium]HDY83587.1 hypothetical protein [Halieaceae bacterium]
MRLSLLLILSIFLFACADYEIKNLVKSDIDLVADEFIAETRAAVRELVVKLYKRNPVQLQKNPGMTIEGRLAQLRVHRHTLDFPELNDKQGINAMNIAFDPTFRGDRVFALMVGLGSMLREAYRYKAEMFLTDQLEPEVLLASARNVEVLLWKLKNARKPNGEHYLITYEYKGVVDNLSFERLFGRIIILQEMMARIADDANDRTVTGAVHAVSKVFMPLPI